MRPEHLSLFRRPGRPAVHPDGTWAVVPITRTDVDEDTYATGLWRLDLDDGGLTPFTFGPRDGEPVFSPDGRWLAFVRAVDGGKPQLTIMPSGGGEARALTDHPLGVSGAPAFSPDSRRIAYTARVPEPGRYGTADGVGPEAEPPRHITRFTYRSDGVGFTADRPVHVFVVDVPPVPDPVDDPPRARKPAGAGPGEGADGRSEGPGERSEGVGPAEVGAADARLTGARPEAGVSPVRVTTVDADHREPVWTHDGTELLVLRGGADLLLPELVRHAPEEGSDGVVLQTGDLGPSAVRLGDGDQVWLLLVDYGADGMDFIGRSPALHRARLTAEGLVDVERLSDPETRGLSSSVFVPVPGGVVVTESHRGTTRLLRFGADAGVPPAAVLDGPVEVTDADAAPDGTVVLAATGTDSVGDVWVAGPAHAGARRLTDLSSRLRAEAGVIEPGELVVPSDDDYPVHGWVAVPEGDGPHPVLLLIHGGPHAQYTPTFFDEVQVYAKAGYAVVFCNPRGSSGYGQAHGRAIVGGFGDRDAADVLAFLDGALEANPSLDAGRVGVLGGSYGGYMTAWLTTRTDRFAAAIVERGFLDPVSFEGSSDIGWFFGLRYVGEEPAAVAAQSPMAHIERVRTPTLVIHSEQDWRCPVEQGQRWYVGLRRRGVEAELLLFPGEGHELSRSGRPKHRVARFEHILRWWDKHLPVAPPSGDE